MKTLSILRGRGALALTFGLVLAAGSCREGTGETTKELAVEAVQDLLTNPLGSGAPVAGVVLGIDKTGLEAVRRVYEARAVRAQQLANDAQGNRALQSRYEQEADLYNAARDCLVTRDCAELNAMQQAMRTAAILEAEANRGGGGHSD